MPLNPSIPKSASGDGVSIENESGQTIAVDDNGGSLTVDGPLTDTELRASPVPVSGTVSVNEPVSVDDNGGSLTIDGTVTADAGSGTFTVGDGGGSLSVDDGGSSITVDGTVSTTLQTSSTATLTNVASSATNVTLLASNGSRKMAMFFNDGSKILYIKLGTTASLTSFTVRLDPRSYYELPTPVYTGQIDGIWDAANGSARITELT